MNDRRLVAGCLLGSFEGTDAPEWLLAGVSGGLGGVLLFAQNVVDDEQVARLCAQLRAARADVIIAIDEEGGEVTRLDARHGSDVPCPAAFGFVDDQRLTRAAYTRLGRRLHDLGIDLTLAPCADINSNPLNPIIGVRAFGETSDVVARHAMAAIAGFGEGGVAACVKHFPGHGDTSDDTHLRTARVAASMETLGERELVPFAAAIAEGVAAVLTAHLTAVALDDAPVSLSAPWTNLLRESMGFAGVVVTDALDMDGVALGRGIEGVADAAVHALVAGADLLCLGSNFDEAMTATVVERVLSAVADGRIERDQLESSIKRISGLRHGRAVADATHDPARDTARDVTRDAAREVAERAIVVDGRLPAGPFAVLECRPRLSMASFNVAWGIATEVSARGWFAQQIHPDEPIEAVCDAFLGEAAEMPVLVVVRDRWVHAWQGDVIARCVAARPDAVVVEMGWPPPERPPGAAYIVTHGAARVSAQALVARLSPEHVSPEHVSPQRASRES